MNKGMIARDLYNVVRILNSRKTMKGETCVCKRAFLDIIEELHSVALFYKGITEDIGRLCVQILKSRNAEVCAP
jgi:hypothetical protein